MDRAVPRIAQVDEFGLKWVSFHGNLRHGTDAIINTVWEKMAQEMT
jgi:hypothetical protein